MERGFKVGGVTEGQFGCRKLLFNLGGLRLAGLELDRLRRNNHNYEDNEEITGKQRHLNL
jgi:hypothetical protein